jgi:predicted cupin superfamily sugar epimerase
VPPATLRMNPHVERLVAELQLARHPEGGFYRETFRSADRVTTRRGTTRSALTTILFALGGDDFSAFHRLTSDEIWHFYRGDPLSVEIIDSAGAHQRRVIGPDGPWQIAVPAGAHFASHVANPLGYALVGCDVAPGFEFADFFLATRAVLTAQYPQLGGLIARFTR